MRVLALLVVLFAGPVQAQDWSALIPEVAPNLGRVVIKKGGNAGVCSAVVYDIRDGFALAISAAHCYDRQPTERMDVTVNGRNAVAVHSNAILDLAILQFRVRDETAIVFAPKSPPAGTAVAILGYAFGIEQLAVQFGRVSVELHRETKAIFLDAMTIFGDSGGPTVDEQGRLIAINSRILYGGLAGQASHISAAVPIEAVRDFTEDYAEIVDRTRRKP